MPSTTAYAYARGEAMENILRLDAREGIAKFIEKRDPNWVS